MPRESESIIEELEDMFFTQEYPLNLLSKLKDTIQEELNKAVQDEREACALICDNFLTLWNGNILACAGTEGAFEICAEAIRKRSK